MFKVGDCVEYISDGETGIVIGLETSSGVPDYYIEWSSGKQSWEEEAALRGCTPIQAGDTISLTAEVVSVGVDGKTAMVRIAGMTECYLVPIAGAYVK